MGEERQVMLGSRHTRKTGETEKERKKNEREREMGHRRTFYASYVAHAYTDTYTRDLSTHRYRGILTHGIPVVGPRDGFSWQRGWY